MSEELTETKKGQGGKGIAIAALGVGIVALLMAVMAFAATQGKSVLALEDKVSEIINAGEVQANRLGVLDFRMAEMQRENVKSYVALQELANAMEAAHESETKEMREMMLQGAVGDMASKAQFLESRLSNPEQKETLAKIKELLASMQQGSE